MSYVIATNSEDPTMQPSIELTFEAANCIDERTEYDSTEEAYAAVFDAYRVERNLLESLRHQRDEIAQAIRDTAKRLAIVTEVERELEVLL